MSRRRRGGGPGGRRPPSPAPASRGRQAGRGSGAGARRPLSPAPVWRGRQAGSPSRPYSPAGSLGATASQSGSSTSMLPQNWRPPKRPGCGTDGEKFAVIANHFLVEVAGDIHCYDVCITPSISREINKDVVARVTHEYGESHFDNRISIYDGARSLYTAGPLPFDVNTFVVKLEHSHASSSSRSSPQFKVAIKKMPKLDLSALQLFLQGKLLESPWGVVSALGGVLRAAQCERYLNVGQSYFSPEFGYKGTLDGDIEYWQGFSQSLQPTQMGLSCNIDVSVKSFYEPILVSDFLEKYFDKKILSHAWSDQDLIKVRDVIKGIKVTHTHLGYVYKITGITNQPLSQLTVTLNDEVTPKSMVEYFHDKYGIKLRYTALPALQAGSEARPTFLPIELCRIVKGQRYSNRLNERQMNLLIEATQQDPAEKAGNIKEMVSSYCNREKLSKDFGISVGDDFTLCDARLLPTPKLNYRATEGNQRVSVTPNLGQWNMGNKKVIDGGTVRFWTCVCFAKSVKQDKLHSFCKQLADMCKMRGMEFNRRPVIPIITADDSQIENAITDVYEQSKAKIERSDEPGKQLQLLLVVLPNTAGAYGEIKRVCEIKLGIVTQCCQPKSASQPNQMILEGLALKINVKVGGRNVGLNDAIQGTIPLASDGSTIIIGADVTHPAHREDSSPSIAAVVASMDWPGVTKYRGVVSPQGRYEEIIKNLYTAPQDNPDSKGHGGMIRELLMAFEVSTGQKPRRIIFYRDGVSESQFRLVLQDEVNDIREACLSLQNGYRPSITVVVVQKRHSTRLFPAWHEEQQMTDKSDNIQPGTIVDTKICHPRGFDFYLKSHPGIKGRTSRPIRYHMLLDENGFSADGLQNLTYNLCFTYARCTNSVSIVPPVYYAHLLAFRARYYLQGKTSDVESLGGEGGGTDLFPSINEKVKEFMFFC